jgi:Ca-activated chloride channel homolog
MSTGDIFYDNPAAAYLFFLVPVIFGLFFYLSWHRNRVMNSLGGKDAVSKIIYRRPKFNFWRKIFILINVWVFATISLMDPKGNARYPESFETDKNIEKPGQRLKKRKAHEVIFLMDISASMDVADMRGGRKRLEIAKEIVDETIRQLDGETVSLYAFTSESDKLVPSTMDYIFTRLVLRGVDINEEGVGGTNIYRAVQDVLGDYPSKPDEKLKTIIVLSDGEDIEYEDDSDVQKKEYEQTFVQLIGDPAERNIRIVTVGLGSEKGGEIPEILFQGEKVESHLDPTLLKVISKNGRGEYFMANQHGLISLTDLIIEQVNRDPHFLRQYEVETQAYLDQSGDYFIYDSHYKRPIMIAIIFLGMIIIFPENWRRHKW